MFSAQYTGFYGALFAEDKLGYGDGDSAAFTFGDHLGFTAGVKPDMIMAVIVGKLVGGVTAVFFAMLLADRMILSIEKNAKPAPDVSTSEETEGQQ